MPERKELAPQGSVLKQLFFDSRVEVTSSPFIDFLNTFSQKRGHAGSWIMFHRKMLWMDFNV